MRSARIVWAVAGVVLTAGCAVRMGGPAPVEQDAITLHVTNETAEQVAAQLREHGAEVAILSSTRDSAFYADVAARAGMKSTRPGRAGSTTFAFLGPQAIGDTTLSIKVNGGGEVQLHDALYRIDKERRLDLMAVRFESANLRESVRALLGYFSTDVMATAAVVMAVEAPTPALGDSISVLLRAAFGDTWECTKEGHNGPRNPNLPIRMFYGPSARIGCRSAEVLNNPGGAILGHLEVLR